MAISSTYRNDYIGNGATATYAYNFKIFAADDLRVIVTDANGGETVLIKDTHYSVTGTGVSLGGYITLVAGLGWMTGAFLTNGYKLAIERNRSFAQSTDLRNQATFFPAVHEDTFDHALMSSQRALSVALRGVRLPEGLNLGDYGMVLPTPQASKPIGWNATADELTNLDVNVVTPTSIDSINVPFLQTGSGAASRSTRSKLRDGLSVKDFGAVGDGSTDDTNAINNALSAAATTGGSVFLPQGTYKVTNTLVVPAGVHFYGLGRLSKIASSILQASLVELVRLNGDYASISKMWLTGRGQVTNAADANRGIWIGAANHTTASSYCQVEDMTIDQFTGNGVSGVYTFSVIKNNTIINNTDAGIFLPPTCTDNLVEGNTCNGSRYSGIDLNGARNRVIGNICNNNGGGNLDQASWNGIMLSSIDASNPCNLNTVIGNWCKANQGSGIRVYANTAGTPAGPYGNIIKGNVVTGHTNAVGLTEWPGGICVLGGNYTIVEGNIADGNCLNFVVCGFGTPSALNFGTIVQANISLNAVTNGTLGAAKSGHGFFFPGAVTISWAGGGRADHLICKDNVDYNAAADGFRWDIGGASGSFTGHRISSNKSINAGAYGFNCATPSAMTDFSFAPGNCAVNAATANYNGFSAIFGLTQNSPTPSVLNANLVVTQNTVPTTVTNLLNGAPGQIVLIKVNDNNTIFDFTGANLKGNGGLKFKASTGDSVWAAYDGAVWHCFVQHITGYATGQSNGVAQGSGSGKATAVTNDYVCGQITLDNASVNADTSVSFTLNNSMILAGSDHLKVRMMGGPNADLFTVTGVVTGVGTATITVRNISGGAVGGNQVVAFEVFHQA